jgi:hypothetical protein
MGRISAICVGDDLKRRTCKLASLRRMRAYTNMTNVVLEHVFGTLFRGATRMDSTPSSVYFGRCNISWENSRAA